MQTFIWKYKFRHFSFQAGLCRRVLDQLQEQVETSQLAKRHCSIMSKALSLFGYLDVLEAIYRPDDLTNSEAIQAVFKCTAYDADNFLELQKYETGKGSSETGNGETGNGETWSPPDFTRANFMNCFQFLQESDEGKDCLPYRSKNIDLSTLSFLQRLAFAGKN